MSLFSRLFRKVPPPAPAPEKPPAKVAAAAPGPPAPDRALAIAREEAALKAAVDAGDAETIAALAVDSTSTKVRQQAAQAIEDPTTLRRLIRDVRGGNDKSVYRILMAKRDALLVRARKDEQLRSEIGAVAAAIERHSQRPHDPLFTATLEQLESRWKTVAADADPSVAHTVQQAIDRSREVIAQHLRQIALPASRELAPANAAETAQRLREVEEKAAAVAAAESAQLAAAQRKEQAQKYEAEALAFREIGGLVRRAQAALNGGSTSRAAGLRRLIEERLPAAPPLPVSLSNQVQHLDSKLNELKDWKSFSVIPKRAELLEEMESLVGASLEPVALADRIKELREEWRTLSKGAGENPEADWLRFQDAAQKAYQPCQEYFEAQALVRQENLRNREALLQRLAEFEAGHNWEQPDWRTVIAALWESKQQWRRYFPVDRAAGRELQGRFAALTANLQGRLEAEYARNVKQKGVLIERAQILLAGEDSRKAIDEVKGLQSQWRAVGPVPRAEDQRLWEEFRRCCDAVFQKRQHEFAEYTAGLDANKAKAIALCEELEKVATSSGADLLASAAHVPDLRLAFEGAGEFPRADARELRGRFERAAERCEKAIARQRARDAEHSWTDLFDVANRVRAYRFAIARNVDVAERDALRQAAQDHLASVGQWPKGGLEAIKRELAKDAPGNGDFAVNEVALRRLCIRAEILTDLPTPPEDQQLRREYQVQRLMQSMGQGMAADDAQLDSMAIEWIGAGPIDEATYMQLVTRFTRCRGS